MWEECIICMFGVIAVFHCSVITQISKICFKFRHIFSAMYKYPYGVCTRRWTCMSYLGHLLLSLLSYISNLSIIDAIYLNSTKDVYLSVFILSNSIYHSWKNVPIWKQFWSYNRTMKHITKFCPSTLLSIQNLIMIHESKASPSMYF